MESFLLQNCPDVLTVPEAAELLRIASEDMQKLVDNGEIQHIIICNQVLVLKPFLEAFIDCCCKVRYTNGINSDVQASVHLDNRIQKLPCLSSKKGDKQMGTKINQQIIVNGNKHWIRANSIQELTDKILSLSSPQTIVQEKHLFSDYAWNWFNTYSRPNVETATAVTYERQLTLYLLPAFDGLTIEDITTDDVQRLFNGMTGAKTTKEKAKMVLNQIFNSAIEDKLINQNPLNSRRLKIMGNASRATPPYSVEQMRYIVSHLDDVQNPIDRMYLAIQALHPLRLEEVLGLHPDDIDLENMQIHIRRAVTHPKRNQPEIKAPKTSGSTRTIGLSSLALPFIPKQSSGEFLFGGDAPLSYTQVRRICDRIKRDTGFSENITPIRFRTTVLTDLYEQTKDIKLAQSAAGHTTSAMTLKYYVKGRGSSAEASAAIDKAYSA